MDGGGAREHHLLGRGDRRAGGRRATDHPARRRADGLGPDRRAERGLRPGNPCGAAFRGICGQDRVPGSRPVAGRVQLSGHDRVVPLPGAWAAVTTAVVIALAAIGLAFSLSGVVGILRMPDLYCRIQCATKTITMGALPVLVALVVGEGPVSPYGSRALLVAVVLLVVNPASSHALARAAYKAGVPM